MTDLYSQAIKRVNTLLKEAYASKLPEPAAMTLATVDLQNHPSARTVLLQYVDEQGFVFYADLNSRKAGEIRANPLAAICIHWEPLDKQVLVEGGIKQLRDEEANTAWNSLPREYQLGASGSRQSSACTAEGSLKENAAMGKDKVDDNVILRPASWSGYRLLPNRIEFWIRQPFRLHERICYRQKENGWEIYRLYP